MKRYTTVEKLAHVAHHPIKPIKLWQVVVRGQVLYESANKGLCVWWCKKHCIKQNLIAAVY